MNQNEQSRVTVIVDGKQGINELGKLEMQASDLRNEIKNLKKGTDEYIKANEKLDRVKSDIAGLRQEIGLSGLTMNQLNKYQLDLSREINNTVTKGTARYSELKAKLIEVKGVIQAQKDDVRGLSTAQEGAAGSMARLKTQAAALEKELSLLAPDTAAFAAKLKELKAVEGQIGSVQNKMSGLSGAWKEFKSGALSMAGGVIGGNLMLMAAQKLADFIPNLISSQAKLSDSLADLRKTTGMTIDEVKDFNKQLSKIDTRTPTEELRKIAIVAGQLGIAKKDILGFTTSVDTLVVALGDEFQGGAEEITKQVGALRNIFSDIKSDKVDEDMMHIGNALNQLGAEGAATGPVMSDMASRIGGVGISLGLTSGQVLGLSATMQELNITSERGSTAVTKILQKMAAAPQEFAVVAGMAAKDFKQLVDNDIYGALVKVVEGSNKTGTSATALAAILKELDVDGAGASEVFAKLGSNTDLLAKKVSSATAALKGTDSIMSEFNVKNENMAAKMEKIGKAISKAFTFSSVSSGLEGLVNWVYKLIPAAEKQSEVMQREFQSFKGVSAEVLSLNVGNKRRVELINELKESYPEYLGQINAETASNQELKKALDNINDALVKKIVTQKAGEKLQEQLQIEADLLYDLGQKNIVLRDAMTLMYEQGGRGAYQSVKLLQMQDEMKQKSIDFSQQLLIVETEAADGRIKGITATNPYLQSAKKRLEEAQVAELKYMAAKKLSNELDKERAALLKAMGIKDEKKTGDDPVVLNLDAARKIRDAKIALITDEYEQKRQKLQAAADDEKAAFEKMFEKEEANAAQIKANAHQIAEYKKLVQEKLDQDLIKLSHEKDRTIKDLSLSLYDDELQAKKSKLIEQATRDVKDFVGTEQQKADYAMLIDAKLKKDIAAAETEYRKKSLEEEEKLKKEEERIQKEKVEAAKKARQQELDDATAFAELQVLVTQKDTNVMGFEVQKSEAIIRELKRRKYAELENTELTQEQRLAITQRYDKQINAVEVAGRASNVEAQIGLLTVQMQKELAKEELTENEKYNIQAKYIDKINQLLDEQEKQEQEKIKNRVIGFVDAFKTIVDGINEINAIEIDNQFIELDRLKQYQDQQYENNKQRLDAQVQQEEAAKNARLSQAEAEKNANIAKAKAQYDSKKISEKEYNRLREKAETDYNALKTNEDNTFTANKEANEKKLANEKQKIEDDYNKKQRDLKIKQWQADQQAKLMSAMMEGAVAIVRASPNPYLMTLAAVTTGLSMAKIDAAEMPAFAEGGSTGAPIASGGMVNKPYLATVAEKGAEYVIPNWQLQVPAVANIVRMLEVMRVNKSTTFPTDVASAAASSTGNVNFNNPVSTNEALLQLLVKMDNTLDKMQQRLDNPKPSPAILDFNQFHEDYNRALNTITEANV